MFFSVRRKATQSLLIQDASTSDSQVTHASTFQHERPATASISVVECRRRQPGDGVYAQWWRRGKYLCNRTEKGRWLVSCCPGSKAKDALPPLPLKPLNISFKKKTHTHTLTLTPPPPPFPLPHHSPSPCTRICCTNQEQMSAGAVLKDPAVLDASHMLFIQRWRLTARLLVKPISGRKKKEWKKKHSPNAFKSLQKQNI